MYNVATIKKTFKYTIAACATLFACSCGDSSANDAQSLYNEAKDCYHNGEFNTSITLLDSLKSNYTNDIELLKKGLHLRTLNQEGIIRNEINKNDSLLSVLETEIQNLSKKFKYIKHKDMVEGYYIHKSIADKAGDDNRTTIEPRIDEEDMFFLVSFLKGQDIKHTAIKLSSSNGTVSTSSVAYDGARNYRYKSDNIAYESISFMNNQCDTIGHFVANNHDNNIKLIFNGKKQYTTTLDKKTQKAISDTYRYATIKNQGKSAIKKKMLLEQKLIIAQKQIKQTTLTE